MIKIVLPLMLIVFAAAWSACAKDRFESDTFPAPEGDLKIAFIGHGSLLFSFNGKNVYVDPFGKLADFGALPRADLVLITHEHGDHMDKEAIAKLRTKDTAILLTEACAKEVQGGTVMKNGDTKTVGDFKVEAVPAYNLVHMRSAGVPFHPKGAGNGYVITFGKKRVYVAGDTENIPEMKALAGVDIAFIPMNLPYTMTPEMAADAALMLKPGILYPYHYGETDVSRLLALMKDRKGTEVRVRKMQ
ncbi:MAG: MBL fold metallo-hydrolase [Spirochaetes bacterium]|nr:MAG: MBL fold metallo-hydrolase [Spirochaetota bacterium]